MVFFAHYTSEYVYCGLSIFMLLWVCKRVLVSVTSPSLSALFARGGGDAFGKEGCLFYISLFCSIVTVDIIIPTSNVATPSV